MELEAFNKQFFIEDKETGFIGKIESISYENVTDALEVAKNGIISASFVSDNGDILKKRLLFDDINNITEEEFDERIETILAILNIKINRINKLCYGNRDEEDDCLS